MTNWQSLKEIQCNSMIKPWMQWALGKCPQCAVKIGAGLGDGRRYGFCHSAGYKRLDGLENIIKYFIVKHGVNSGSFEGKLLHLMIALQKKWALVLLWDDMMLTVMYCTISINSSGRCDPGTSDVFQLYPLALWRVMAKLIEMVQ